MWYFSELVGNRVYSHDGVWLGKVDDLLFLPIETPVVTKVVIKAHDKREILAPAQLFKKHNGKGFLLTGPFDSQERKDEEASVKKSIQDQQIMDLKGQKVIRANDVVISDDPGLTIAGIDIGVLGVFRWIGAAKILSRVLARVGVRYKSEFLPWNAVQPLEIAGGNLVLKQEQEKLQRLQPEDLSDYLEKTTTVHALKVLKLMDPELSAQVLADISTGFQSELFRRFSPKKSAEILSLMDADEAVDILLTLSDEKHAEILGLINGEPKDHIVHLLQYAKTPIGNLMNTEYVTAYADYTVTDALKHVKQEAGDFSQLQYIYVLNKEDKLVGVVGVHHLLGQDKETQLFKFMRQNLVLARLTTPNEIALKKMIKYHLGALPVVDENRQMLGIVLLQDIAEIVLSKVWKEDL